MKAWVIKKDGRYWDSESGMYGVLSLASLYGSKKMAENIHFLITRNRDSKKFTATEVEIKEVD